MNEALRQKIVNISEKGGFFCFIPLVFFLPISNAVIETSFGLILICFIINISFAQAPFYRIKSILTDRLNLSLLIFFVCIGLSIFASGPLFAKSLRAWICKWLEGVLLFYAARLFLDKKRIKILLFVLLTSAFLVSVDGIYQWIYGTDFIRGFGLTEVKGKFLSIRATFSHFNNFAGFIAIMFLLNCGLLFTVRKFLTRLPLYLLSFLILINMFFTYSRTAWLSLFCGLLFLIMFYPDKKVRKTFFVLLPFFIGAMITIPFSRGLISSFIQRADAGRFRIWAAAFQMFKESPLIGKGLGLFMDYLPRYGLERLYAHNCYLQILAETGLLGLLPFLWFLGQIIFRGLKKIIKDTDTVFLGLFSAYLAFLLQIFFDTHLYSLKLSILFWILSAFTARYIFPKEVGGNI
jgi:O-antigen ligase